MNATVGLCMVVVVVPPVDMVVSAIFHSLIGIFKMGRAGHYNSAESFFPKTK